MNDNFKEKRALMHGIVDTWRVTYGKDWISKVGNDEFYFNPPLTTELAIRGNLMSRSYNELDAMALSVVFNMEMK